MNKYVKFAGTWYKVEKETDTYYYISYNDGTDSLYGILKEIVSEENVKHTVKYLCKFGHESTLKSNTCAICNLFKNMDSIRNLKKNINYIRPGKANIFTNNRKFFKLLRFGFRKETMYFVMEENQRFYVVELTITGEFTITNPNVPFKTVYAANTEIKANT